MRSLLLVTEKEQRLPEANEHNEQEYPVDSQGAVTSEQSRRLVQLQIQGTTFQEHVPAVCRRRNNCKGHHNSVFRKDLDLGVLQPLGLHENVQDIEDRYQDKQLSGDKDYILSHAISIDNTCQQVDILAAIQQFARRIIRELVQEHHREDVLQACNKASEQCVDLRNQQDSTSKLGGLSVHEVTAGHVVVHHSCTSIIVWRFCTAPQKFTKLLKLLCARTQDIIIVTHLHNFVNISLAI